MKKVSLITLIIATAGLTACSSNKEVPKLDYQSENQKIISLEVPPDLNDPRNGDLYRLPTGTHASPNASKQKNPTQTQVLNAIKDVHIERQGNQRWLVINGKQAAQIWPLLRAFWQEAGFTIYSEEPKAGLLETDWAENRAKLPSQGLRRFLDKVGVGSIYSTSERDKFLIRMEYNSQGGLDVFFTHKGLEEVYDSKNQDSTVWQPRPSDPNLEAAFMARFMQYLGADDAVIEQQLAKQKSSNQGTEFAKRESNSVLVYGNPERNINRIASALDRIGLTVLQFVSERGIFVVRTAPSVAEAIKTSNEKQGWFSSLFGGKKEQNQNQEQTTQLLVALEDTGNGQRIHLLDQSGRPYQGENADVWLDGLYRELH